MSTPIQGSASVSPSADAASGTGAESFNLLIVAAEEAVGDILANVVKGHLGGRPARVHVVAPSITETHFEQLSGDVDEAMLRARERLAHSLGDLRRHGIEVTGGIGDSDPLLAIEDELSQFPADEIMIVTHAPSRAGWMEDDLFEKAREIFRPEITHVVLEKPAGGGGLRPTLIEHADEGVEDVESRDSASLWARIVARLQGVFRVRESG